jgi:hypothetical protein
MHRLVIADASDNPEFTGYSAPLLPTLSIIDTSA